MNCKFFVKKEGCHRFPPTVAVVRTMDERGPGSQWVVAEHPYADENDWCGEFVKKIEEV